MISDPPTTLVIYGFSCFGIVVVFTLILLIYFSRVKLPCSVFVLVWISWMTVGSVCFLVPMDLMGSKSQSSLNMIWNIVFWINFILNWIGIPLINGYYIKNGGFNWKEKWKISLQSNFILFITWFIIGFLSIIYLTLMDKWTWSRIQLWAMGANHLYGFVFLILCAGFGLIEFPRIVYNWADLELQENQYYISITHLYYQRENIQEKRKNLLKIIEMLNQTFFSINIQNKHHPLSILNLLVLPWQLENQNPTTALYPILMDNIPQIITEIEELKRNNNLITINQKQWCKLHEYIQLVLDSTVIIEQRWKNLENQSIKNKTRRCYYYFYRGLFFLMILISIAIIVSELFISIDQRTISAFYWIIILKNNTLIGSQIFIFSLFVYFSLCCYYSIFQLQLSLIDYIGYRCTHESALLLNASLLLRICIPLAYNFILLLNVADNTSSLQNFIGIMNDIPFLGGSFTNLFPFFIVLFTLLMCINRFRCAMWNLMSYNQNNNINHIHNNNNQFEIEIEEGKLFYKKYNMGKTEI